jgi:hypothetical protein
LLLAHALRYVDLLLNRPLTVQDPHWGVLQLPHPASFLLQKQCIRDRRQRRGKAATDQADTMFTLWGFCPRWDDLIARWRELEAQRGEWSAWGTRVRQQMATLYASPTAPGSREVANVFAQQPGRVVSAEEVARIVQSFLAQLNAPP